MTHTLMAHLVAGYPSERDAFTVAQALADGGVAYLEIQFPFSDPSADGPAIQAACQAAIEGGFTVNRGFDFVRRVREKTGVPVFIMSYAGLVFNRGVSDFAQAARSAGAEGLIVPDLCPGMDEGLYAACRETGISAVPVTVPTMPESRITALEAVRPEYVYAALRTGITGTYTELGDENMRFLDRLNTLGAKVMAGFGIREHAQVVALTKHVHAAIVGSAFVEIVTEQCRNDTTTGLAGLAKAIRTKARDLCEQPN
jgi:tryptophan synthase alpha chain